mgnify:CR=1 FL=1
MILQIVFFETVSGSRPVEKYIESLENDRAERVLSQLEQLSILGLRGMPPKMIKTVSGIHYLRIKDKKGMHRVFFTIEGGKILLLLHAYLKKEQKLKNSEIELAKARHREWRERHERF